MICARCRSVRETRHYYCQGCGKKWPKRRRMKHFDALKLPWEAYVEANDGYDGCWVCRELGVRFEGAMQRDHAHTKDGGPRGILCPYHNRLLGAKYKTELVVAYAKYLTR